MQRKVFWTSIPNEITVESSIFQNVFKIIEPLYNELGSRKRVPMHFSELML